ncbi:hypothetical protein AVEN_124449-1 [Araneus ventricosus]|uniref:Uncharacterized protein n=1 Tax=Araneus ventricosus TaxID=182803 RepID=A0A4Y2HVZ7_ARAVE|nr:hypothetical protein AVEN_124449-1 [Araneus ventricosus]
MQTVQKLQPNDGSQRVGFAVEMLSRIETEHDFLNRIIFSDEAIFHDVAAKLRDHRDLQTSLHWIFFFWGYVKDKVCSREIRDVEDLRASIIASIATVTMEVLQRTWLELDYRLDFLRATKGAHLEVH